MLGLQLVPVILCGGSWGWYDSVDREERFKVKRSLREIAF